MNKARILVVEDERIVAKDIQVKLKSFGYAVPAVASSAEEALQAISAYRPDLVLMDIVLKGKEDGVEAAHQIHEVYDVPVVYLTAYTDSQTLDRAKETAPFGYILKPFKERDLQIAVEMALYKHGMERRLREHEEWLNTTLESIGDAVIATDVTGIVQFMNAPAEELSGWKKEDALGKGLGEVFQVFDIESHKRMIDPVTSVLMEGHDFQFSNHTLIRSQRGGEVPILQSGSPIKDQRGNIFGVVLVFRDMSEHHRNIDALRRSQERYKLLFEHNPQPMWVFDNESLSFLAVNNSAVQSYGYTEDEFLSMTIKDIRPPEDIPEFVEQLRKPSEDLRQGIWKHKKKDGSVILAEISTHELQFENRDARLVLAIDVTERQSIIEAIRESEERYRYLIDTARDAIFTLSRDALFASLNPAFEMITGLHRDEWIGRSFTTLIHPDDLSLANEQFLNNMKGIQSPVYELRIATSSGTYVVAELMTTPQETAGEITGVLGVARDITERKRIEDHLRESQKLEGLGTLAGGIAHDFNNILGIVLGHSSLVRKAIRDEDEASVKSLNAIATAVERGSGVVRQLMAFARKANIQVGPVDLNHEIHETMVLLHETLPRSISFNLKLAEGLPLINADRNQLHQVLLNLSVNARDAMPDGGTLTFSTKVVEGTWLRARIASATEERYVQVSIEDTGIGIEEAVLGHIFEPFYTTKGLGRGTGLGLSVAYGVVKNHRGFIEVDNTPNEGTTFFVFLPVMIDTPKSARVKAETQTEDLRGTETILIVEDEEDLVELLHVALGAAGYKVISAGTGPEGVELYTLHRKEIAAILSDVGLPGFSGWEMFERIKQLDPDVKMIIASGYIDPSRSVEMGNSSNFEILEKPYRPTEVLSMLRAVLDRGKI
jgi:two-component system, cell cycle sensor histidine kinase and response regulator CckA